MSTALPRRTGGRLRAKKLRFKRGIKPRHSAEVKASITTANATQKTAGFHLIKFKIALVKRIKAIPHYGENGLDTGFSGKIKTTCR